jgi:uncharacterized protein YcfJ
MHTVKPNMKSPEMNRKNLPRLAVVALACLAATGAWATEYGTVISSNPIVTSVPVAQRVCSDEQVAYRQQSTGGGALVGAIAGAVVGHAIGGGVIGSGVGMVAGAAIGDQAEANGNPPAMQTVQRCRSVTRYETRPAGYDVVYEYQGERRSTRLAQDPGERIALDIHVAPSGELPPTRGPAPAYAEQNPPVEGEYTPPPPPRTVYVQPAPVYVNPYPYVSVAPVFIGGWGWGWGHYHRR